MREKEIYQTLVEKMEEVSFVPPQNFGFFTPFYKMIVPQFKFHPWRILAFFSFSLTFLFYLLFGQILITLASLLQSGF